MAHLLRGKQAGIEGDFSAGLTEQFAVDDIIRYGINSQVSTLAYDPVQSLLAVGTNATRFGHGQIYVFGHGRVAVVFELAHKCSVKTLQFCAEKLICFDSRNDLSVFSLETKHVVSSYSPPGTVTAICCDPTLDYVLLGMQSGDIFAYDLDRGTLTPFKLPSFWKDRNPRARVTPIVSLALHPRDIGSLLIGYAEGAVIYSFKQNAPIKFFQYEVPRGAPGGNPDPAAQNVIRHPPLTHAVWHPTGTFVLTGHDDGSLVFWDTKDGRVVMARTVEDTNINKSGPSSPLLNQGFSRDDFKKEPLKKIIWCANQDPEDTAILISGGAPVSQPSKGLALFELGRTPVYATASWQILTQYLESPRRQRILPTPPNTEVVDFCLIPRTSPYFAGAHDPIAVLTLLSTGEVVTMSFPSGYPIPASNQLHVSLTFVHPFIECFNLSSVDRAKWLGMTENRNIGPKFLQGGAEASRPKKRFEHRNIAQVAGQDGTVRLWDAGHGDDIENPSVVQVDVALAIGSHQNVEITELSLAGASGEFAAGTKGGEVAIFRWGHNRRAGRGPPDSGPNNKGSLTDITGRADSELVDGLLPFSLLDMDNGRVTALKLSDVGFVACGSEGGKFCVIDLRGPAIIFEGSVQDFSRQEKRGALHKKADQSQGGRDWPVAMEFSVMTVDGESYSSILLFVGTAQGSLATFKILPQNGGRYGVQFAGITSVDDRVVRIAPLRNDNGFPAYASQQAVAGLGSGMKVNGFLLVITRSGAKIFKPASGKGAHKSWDHVTCESASVCMPDKRGTALVTLGSDGVARGYTIPGLKEFTSVRLSSILDQQKFSNAVISQSGDVLGWCGPAETALINVFGSGLRLNRSKDVVFNPELLIPPRPTISGVQWLTGTQYVTPADLDLLIGGPNRPPSKRMLELARANEAQERAARRTNTAGSSDEGYWAAMQRQINERTQKLGLLGDSVDKLEDQSASWADDVSKFMQRQKRNLVMGAVKGKFGL